MGALIGKVVSEQKDILHVIMSDLPFDPFLAQEFAGSIIEYCKKKKIGKIIIVSGMETMNRDPKSPKIYGLVTHQSLEKLLYQNIIDYYSARKVYLPIKG